MNRGVFFADILRALPDGCIIQFSTTNDSLIDVTRKLNPVGDGRFFTVQLGSEERRILTSLVLESSFVYSLEHVVARFNGDDVFLGYDGLEYGQIKDVFFNSSSWLKEYLLSNDLDLL
jgi:hypothetical protein